MARVSKRKTGRQCSLSRCFRVGIYARLSVGGTKACGQKDCAQIRKNESISTQIAIAKQYLEAHPEMKLYDCYTDLGKTGTNFKREGFERMMQDVRKKRIDCVIVKDLSRFGRNHMETGNYIQKIFPFMGIRFIALTDGIDTFETKSGVDDMAVNLKNLINEMYAGDIAEKVRSSKRSSQERGSYTGGIPPYGYQAEWVDKKKCLFICPEASGIVKEIYEMFLSGKSMRQIAKDLYAREIHRPSVYRKTGCVYRQEGERLEQWTAGTVKRILTNPIYMGCLVQGLAREKQYKIRNRFDMDKGAYCVRWGTHEPLVSEDVFFQAAAIFEKLAAKRSNTDSPSRKVPLEEDIYAGILFCGSCGKRMARAGNVKQLTSGKQVRNYGYYCPASRRLDDMKCPAKSIGRSVLDEMIKNALCREFALPDSRPGKLFREDKKLAEGKKQQMKQEIIWCEKRQKAGKRRGSELYMKYYTGILSLKEYQQSKRENEKFLREMSERECELRCRFTRMEQEIEEKEQLLRNFMKGNEKARWGRDDIRALINRIDVYADRRVEITFCSHGSI